MARLKEKDKRPKHKFSPGDIVIPHPKRTDLITVGQGIVLKECEWPKDSGFYENATHDTQWLLVYFAARDVDLYIKAREFARTWVDEPDYEPEGMLILNNELQLVKSQPTWLDSPTFEEVQMLRFIHVAENL